MARYRISGALTYASQANRDNVYTAVNTALSSYPLVVGDTERYPAGVNTSGTLALTISLIAPDEATAVSVRNALTSAWSASSRSAGFVGLARLSP